MQEQILENKQEQEKAAIIIPSKQAIKELLAELKKLKNHKDDLLLPLIDELEEIEDKKKRICDEITILIQDLQETVKTDNGAAIWKLMPTPSLRYDTKALDAITDTDIRKILDACKKLTKQGEPKVTLEVY